MCLTNEKSAKDKNELRGITEHTEVGKSAGVSRAVSDPSGQTRGGGTAVISLLCLNAFSSFFYSLVANLTFFCFLKL